MSTPLLGILIGGILPALLYGIAGVFSKASTKEGIGFGLYIVIAGIAVTLTGILVFALQPDRSITIKSAFFAGGFGALWAIGTALVVIGLSHFGMPLSKLVPLYNMNTLIAVLLALWIFSEWKDVSVTKILLGAVLIVSGGILVARS